MQLDGAEDWNKFCSMKESPMSMNRDLNEQGLKLTKGD